tara:strand:- start:1297 stop:1893 length:597 start_codon:yes stop_codon:yes gene_type:complete
LKKNKIINNKERDNILISEAIKGNQKAYTQLISLYWESIQSQFSFKVKNKEDIEDLTILVFTKAFDNLSSYNKSYAFITWITRIANNTLIDFFRKKKIKTSPIQKYDSNSNTILNLIDSELDPELFLINVQKKNKIIKIIDSLKPKYKELVYLRYIEELTYNEISIKLNISSSLIKTRLFRARAILIDLINKKNNGFK